MKITLLPATIKFALTALIVHALIYAWQIIEAMSNGITSDPRWFFHFFVCIFIFTKIPTARPGLFFITIAYCLFVPTRMLYAEYVPDHSIEDVFNLMHRTIIMCLPLYLVAVFLIAGRTFYFPAKVITWRSSAVRPIPITCALSAVHWQTYTIIII